ncbi:TIGR03915 family putative DNA repair protein [Anaeromassilibacillus sp. An200]|uniref:TIGR03915 family putative DNA repair protein n=1 Tax=Anaeromassilibacillus sp. An200 TaxID=1965587 RepID=UPI000B3A50C7|nr:TIGR03915 family putative DNA repair protein [Anaeromassilibacillus sp. An200]OUP08977.1 hypothetical protein B5F35_12815 [Anaeromassilibacillus sp. An200]
MNPRLPSSPKAYRYDGSFDGFLCCVFESFLKKETPAAILPEDGPFSLYPEKQIETDTAKAARVWRSLPLRISPAAADLARSTFLTCMPEKELPLLRVLQEGFRIGGSVMNFLADDDLSALRKAVSFLHNESHLLSGFVRFSEYGSVLVSIITPKNHVLPLLAQYFCSRMPGEQFLIFDKTHREALIHRPGDLRFCPMDELTLPPPDRTEAEYRALWKRFYDTIAIEGRINPRCRMSHMPKRYWGNMTEFQETEIPPEQITGAVSSDVLPVLHA